MINSDGRRKIGVLIFVGVLVWGMELRMDWGKVMINGEIFLSSIVYNYEVKYGLLL